MTSISKTLILALMLGGASLHASTTHYIEVSTYDFEPGELEVETGDTIVWFNSASTPHTTTSLENIPEDAESWNDTLNPQDSFEYVVKVPGDYDYHCALHPARHSGSFNASGETINSVDEEELSRKAFKLYPNPARDFIKIEKEQVSNADFSVQVVGLNGKELLNREITAGKNGKISIQHLNKGLYLVNIQTSDQLIQKRLLVE